MSILHTLVVKLVGDVTDFESKMQEAGNKMQNLGGELSKTGMGMTAGVTVPLAAIGIGAASAASKMEESLNKAKVVFGNLSGPVVQFSKTASTSLGISQQAALEASGTFGNLLQSMGTAPQSAADMSMGMVKLASDLASFNNISPEEALEKLRAGMVGETEPLRALGVNLTAAAVENEALKMGLAATAKDLTPAMKAQASYALIMQQTQSAQGDFARTSGGLANQLRIAKASATDAAAGLGAILIPIIQKLVGFLQLALAWFQNLSPGIQNMIVIVGVAAAAVGPVLMIVGSLISAIGAILPVIGAVVGVIGGPVLLIIAAVGAAIALLVIAWKNNWGGIQDKVKAVWDFLQPIFQLVITWLKDKIGMAIQGMKILWETVLYPALQKVWAFIEKYIIPIFKVIADIIETVVKIAIQIIVIQIEIFIAVLQKVWEWIQDKILPIFQKIWEFIAEKLGPVFEWLNEKVIKPLVETFVTGLKKALDWFLGILENIKIFLAGFELPDWLTRGSATPFELSLAGINKELRDMARMRLPDLEMGLRMANSLPDWMMAGGRMSMAFEPGRIAAPAGGGGVVINNYVSSPGILDEKDVARRLSSAMIVVLKERGLL